MNNGMNKANLMRAAPSVLVNDKGMNPMVDTLAEALAKLAAKCSAATIYARIDELPEDLLDILAKDFNVYWYNYNHDVETKRRVLKDSFNVRRNFGTRAAMETVISDVWPDSTLEEWFEYGGDPYHFRVIVTTEWSLEEEVRVEKAINQAKNVRSVLDNIIFSSGSAEADLNVAAAMCGMEIEYEANILG